MLHSQRMVYERLLAARHGALLDGDEHKRAEIEVSVARCASNFELRCTRVHLDDKTV